MTILVDNEYMKIIRLTEGVLLNIFKCEFRSRIDVENPRKQLKKIDNYLYVSKEELADWKDINYSIGFTLYKDGASYYPITKVNDKNNWSWEIKTTGSAFSGNTKTFSSLINTVAEIIKEC